jgi:hypothetical protein
MEGIGVDESGGVVRPVPSLILGHIRVSTRLVSSFRHRRAPSTPRHPNLDEVIGELHRGTASRVRDAVPDPTAAGKSKQTHLAVAHLVSDKQ